MHTDHLGGTSIVTNEEGDIVQLLDYYPFGDLMLNEKNSGFDSKKKFTGHEYDEDTNLNYMIARYQSGKNGRFLSIDPITRVPNKSLLTKPQELNSYSYVANNPLKNIDPTGEKVEVVSRSLNLEYGGFGVHTFLRITPDNPEHFGMNSESSFTFTVGAYKDNGILTKRINDSTDTNMKDGQEFKSVEIAAPEGNDTAFIYSILDAYDSYENSEKYGGLSILGENCNGFTNSILESTGAGGLTNEVDPGWPAMPGRTSTISSITESSSNDGYSTYSNDIYSNGYSQDTSSGYSNHTSNPFDKYSNN